jgi:hypothetical protein
MTEVTPQEFDVDAWIDAAERPERGVTLFQKASLLADMDLLAEKIEHAEAAEDLEPALTEVGESRRLRAKYAKIAQEFHESGVEFRVRAVDDHEKRALRLANPDLDASEFGYLVFSEAIVSPRLTPAQVKKLETNLGETQFGFIAQKFYEACKEAPEVSADFLPKPSTQGDGGES